MDDKISDFNLENYNPKSIDTQIKRGARLVMGNLTTIIVIFAATIIVAVTWLDIELDQILNVRFAVNAILATVLYCTSQIAMQDKGKISGMRDPEYVEERARYLKVAEKIIGIGAPDIDEFCEYSTTKGLERRRKAILGRFVKGLSYSEWLEKFSDKTANELKLYVRRNHKRKDVGYVPTLKQIPFIVRVNALKAKNLTPDMMILEESELWSNDAIAPSPSAVVRQKTRSALLGSCMSATFVVSVVFSIASDPTWEKFMFMFTQLFFLIVRSARGYSIGSLAYSVSGVAYHKSQRAKCEEYLAWVENRKKTQEIQDTGTDINRENNA